MGQNQKQKALFKGSPWLKSVSDKGPKIYFLQSGSETQLFTALVFVTSYNG